MRTIRDVLVSLALFAAILVLPTGAQADPPSDLAPTLNSCAGFTKMRATIEVTPTKASKPKLMMINGQAAWFMADAGWGSRTRWAWKDGQFTQHSLGLSGPQVTKVPNFVIANLWSACRSGFAGVSWTARDPSEDGFWFAFKSLGWFKGGLSYPWASGLDLYLGVNKQTKLLTEIVWHKSGEAEWSRIHVAALNWSVPTTPGFGRLAPTVDVPLPPEFVDIK